MLNRCLAGRRQRGRRPGLQQGATTAWEISASIEETCWPARPCELPAVTLGSSSLCQTTAPVACMHGCKPSQPAPQKNLPGGSTRGRRAPSLRSIASMWWWYRIHVVVIPYTTWPPVFEGTRATCRSQPATGAALLAASVYQQQPGCPQQQLLSAVAAAPAAGGEAAEAPKTQLAAGAGPAALPQKGALQPTAAATAVAAAVVVAGARGRRGCCSCCGCCCTALEARAAASCSGAAGRLTPIACKQAAAVALAGSGCSSHASSMLPSSSKVEVAPSLSSAPSAS